MGRVRAWSDPMSRAFLSYSMRDGFLSMGALEEIASNLSAKHESVYVDLLHNRDPRPQEHLEYVLRSSAAFYVVRTPAAFSSPWVRREIALAKRLGLVVNLYPGPVEGGPASGATTPVSPARSSSALVVSAPAYSEKSCLRTHGLHALREAVSDRNISLSPAAPRQRR